MTNAQIREVYDTNPNMTIQRLAFITGKSKTQIVKILMESK